MKYSEPIGFSFVPWFILRLMKSWVVHLLMKKPALIYLLFVSLNSQSQTELVNCYNTYAEVLGGMEDGGVSRYESYYFCVHAKITLCDFYFNDELLQLQKKDTLVLCVSNFIPYHDDPDRQETDDKTGELPKEKRFRVHQQNNTYFVHAVYPTIWNKTITYQVGKKKITVSAKPEFDSGTQEAAP